MFTLSMMDVFLPVLLLSHVEYSEYEVYGLREVRFGSGSVYGDFDEGSVNYTTKDDCTVFSLIEMLIVFFSI